MSPLPLTSVTGVKLLVSVAEDTVTVGGTGTSGRELASLLDTGVEGSSCNGAGVDESSTVDVATSGLDVGVSSS